MIFATAGKAGHRKRAAMSNGELSISKRRLKSLLAAEEFCKRVRADLANHGSVTMNALPYLDRWMALTGKQKYELPKRLRKKR